MTLDEGIAVLARTHKPFTADDIHDLVGSPDRTHQANAKNNMVGAAFRRARQRGLIEPTGIAVRSKQPHRKGGLIQEWIGVRDDD